tara:strand:+ start:2673 stop:3329 length:657 start_codon:yes stop_codon:yes gene_type:complete
MNKVIDTNIVRKVIVTLNELVIDRGFQKINHKFNEEKLQKFLKTKNLEFEDENFIFHFMYNNTPNKKRTKSNFQKIIKNTESEDETKPIIFVIFWDNVNMLNKYENFYSEDIFTLENDKIQIFKYKNLVFNITRHSLVPKHEKVPRKDIKNLLMKLMISKLSQFPTLLTTDPVCKYYNFKVNDLIKIYRTSNGNTHTFYRCVSNPGDNLNPGLLNGYE